MTAKRQSPRVRSWAVLVVSLLLGLLPAATPAVAADTLLVVKNTTVPDSPTARFTFAELEKFPQVTIKTHTDFTDGRVSFVGPLVRDVIATVPKGAATVAHMVAANDYSHDIQLSDFTKYDVILALTANGKRLSLRDKGPIWVMYPIDQNPELKDPAYNSRLVWQLTEIDLE